MKPHNYFVEKTILITGGSSGIGYALAERIIDFNPKAIVIIAHEKEKLEGAVAKLNKLAPDVQIGMVVADIGESQSIGRACREILDTFGTPDILINNAGYAHYTLFHEMTESEVTRHATVNLIGAMQVVHAFLTTMRAAKNGQIVNVVSIAGHMLLTPNLVYCAAKHGMVAWSEGLAIELAEDGITVQTISPGRVETDFFRHESFQKRIAGAETQLIVPMKKVIDHAIKAIVKRKKRISVPYYWSVVAWGIQAFSFFAKPVYFLLLRKRVSRLRDAYIADF